MAAAAPTPADTVPSASCSTASRWRCSGVAPQTTLLEYLREHAAAHRHQGRLRRRRLRRLHGRPRRARDGDARLDWKPDQRLHPAPALGRGQGRVHRRVAEGAATARCIPAQRAMVDCHGSQCGFCTPGFVMSLFGLFKNAHAAVEAGHRGCAVRQPVPLHGLSPDRRRGARDVRRRRRDRLARVRRRAPTARASIDARGGAAVRRQSRRSRAGNVRVRGRAAAAGGRRAPSTRWRRSWSSIRTRASSPAPPTSDCGSPSISATSATSSTPGDVADLRAIRETRYASVHRRRGHAHRRVRGARGRRGPSCTKAWARFASVPIRNSGTLGGNVANGSPIGDSMPALIALGATVVLRRGDVTRELALEDFYLAYQKTALRRASSWPRSGCRARRAEPRRCAPTRRASATTRTSPRCSSASR